MARQKNKKRLMSEINVVPYIDVMLVLLVIFMITAPLLTQGVKVDLPSVVGNPLQDSKQTPLIVTVDAEGRMYLNDSEKPNQPIDELDLMTRVAALIRVKPDRAVVVKGDQAVPYGRVMVAMSVLKRAGVPTVGMATQSPERKK